MKTPRVIRSISAFALGIGALAACDSDINRTESARPGDTRVADRTNPGAPKPPDTIGATPTPGALAQRGAPPSAGVTAAGTDDEVLKSQIKAKLQDQAAAGLANVDVDIKDGVVELTGVVQKPEQKQRAGQVARGVDGVRDVVNKIEVRAA
jgi:hyperosmotically inducible periplasmic protein